MKLTSIFDNGGPIDRRHTGEGADRSPRLSWSDVPAGVVTFALICDDPDAPSPRDPGPEPWVHWIIYNIPADVTELSEGIERRAQSKSAGGALQGRNSWSKDNVGYRGPMPPPGSGAHRYFFKLYALDCELDLDSDHATKDRLLSEMKGHILAHGEVMGTYERR